MISIENPEDEFEKARFEHNKPFSIIDLKFGMSSDVLPTLGKLNEAIVWLDYDGAFVRTMVTDIESVTSRCASGSFIGVTFTNAVPVGAADLDKRLADLKGSFPEYIPENAGLSWLSVDSIAELGRASLFDGIQRIVNEQNARRQRSPHRQAGLQFSVRRWPVDGNARLDSCAKRSRRLPMHREHRVAFLFRWRSSAIQN